jgi:hypothetical protein
MRESCVSKNPGLVAQGAEQVRPVGRIVRVIFPNQTQLNRGLNVWIFRKFSRCCSEDGVSVEGTTEARCPSNPAVLNEILGFMRYFIKRLSIDVNHVINGPLDVFKKPEATDEEATDETHTLLMGVMSGRWTDIRKGGDWDSAMHFTVDKIRELEAPVLRPILKELLSIETIDVWGWCTFKTETGILMKQTPFFVIANNSYLTLDEKDYLAMLLLQKDNAAAEKALKVLNDALDALDAHEQKMFEQEREFIT